MINENEIKKFSITHVGLILPNGEFMSVLPYGHFEKFKQYPEFAQDIVRHEDEISNMYQSHCDSIGEDEHPSWHVFEIAEVEAEDELRAHILEKAYAMGWVRVGYFYNHKNNNFKTLEIEGTTQGLKNAIKIAKHLADKIECLDLIEVNIDLMKKGKKQRGMTTWA